jgi:hypothetical protein
MATEEWDDDIACLQLSDVEKNGLQMYRNYNRSFTAAREKQFAAGVDAIPLDLAQLGDAMSLLVTEDIRFVPVIACAFADEELARMYKKFLPDDIPGGKKSLLGRFGPISNLFNRIQFAFAFDMLYSDVLLALDKLREHRNKISHTWNHGELKEFFETPLPYTQEIEETLVHRRRRWGDDFSFTAESSLRARTIWLLARIFYESRFYPLAKLAQVRPFSALYGERHPRALTEVSKIALQYTDSVAESK